MDSIYKGVVHLKQTSKILAPDGDTDKMARRTKRAKFSSPLGTPRPVDIHVGRKLRERRIHLGLSQEKVGEGVGLTFQQIQKYERGANRIGASRLWQFVKLLDVPIGYFFEGLDKPKRGPKSKLDRALEKRETLELIRNYTSIKNAKARKQIYQLVKTMAKASV